MQNVIPLLFFRLSSFYNSRMIDLNEQNVTEYLRRQGKLSQDEPLIQSLSGGIANVVLKIFDPGAGEKIGTDLRSPAQIKRGVPDKRMSQGFCFVIKQPLAKFRTKDEWLVDVARVEVERDCALLLSEILPAGSVPEVLWYDQENHVLAISCVPTDSVIWKTHLMNGGVSIDAAQQAGVLLAMMHAATLRHTEAQKRYGEPAFFVQQRIDPYFRTLCERHPDLAPVIGGVIDRLLNDPLCLIHGDFTPKNIFLVAQKQQEDAAEGKPAKFPLSHLTLLDFEVAFFGNPAFDVASLVNHLLLKSFYLGKGWRARMMAVDAFVKSYVNAVPEEISARVESDGGAILGALMLARVDGKSPAEYMADEALRERVRKTAIVILKNAQSGFEAAIDHAADALSENDAAPATEK